MTGKAFERFREALERHGEQPKKVGKAHRARCPVHNGDGMSLAFFDGDGMVAVRCWAHECDKKDIVAALGLTLADLFDDPRGKTYEYRSAGGGLNRKVRRTPDKRFFQTDQDGTPPILYRLPDVLRAVSAGDVVYLVEGEQDADTLVLQGVCATTAPMGATNFDKCDVSALKHARVFAVVDRDAAGAKWAATVRTKLAEAGAKVKFVQAREGKDATDHITAGHGVGDFDPYVWPTEEPAGSEAPSRRRVDLGPYLDGTYRPPQPSVGMCREDGVRALYPGRWHTVIAPNETGKTFFALAHCKAELDAGHTVIYLHFEETEPSGTIERLLQLGVPAQVIAERFVWLDCNTPWTMSEVAAEVVPGMTLVTLDGINAACGTLRQSPDKPEAVSVYRATFVKPLTAAGATVLSLGHPVKAKDRQDERHGFGSSAWLDEADGVAFRLKPDGDPVRRGRKGAASVYVVKDRYGMVNKHAVEGANSEGWRFYGTFVVDDSAATDDEAPHKTEIRFTAPGEDRGRAPIEVLAWKVARVLEQAEDHSYRSKAQLGDMLRAAGESFNNDNLGSAVELMKRGGQIVKVGANGGRLVIKGKGSLQDHQGGPEDDL